MDTTTSLPLADTLSPFMAPPTKEALTSAVARMVLLLANLAITPATARTAVDLLEQGTVFFQFLEYVNPLPIFHVEVGSDEHKQLTDALMLHFMSKRYKAGVIFTRRRNSAMGKAEARIRTLVTRFKATQPEDWYPVIRTPQGQADAREKMMLYQARINHYEAELRLTRSRRLDSLLKATTNVSNIFELYKLLGLSEQKI